MLIIKVRILRLNKERQKEKVTMMVRIQSNSAYIFKIQTEPTEKKTIAIR